MRAIDALAKARETWPYARLVIARKPYPCDNHLCKGRIQPGDQYINPGDSNPERAGGFGGYRYCLTCGGGECA